jgi:hypothetical protein
MLVILRIIFTGVFIYCIAQARDNARTNIGGGDLNNAFWVGAGVLAAIASSIVWAPYFGAKIADPLTGGMVQSPPADRKNLLLLLIRWLDKREKHPALIRWLCFIEGVRAPWMPTGFIIGLNHAKPGSWLEKVYAREVFRFNNAENCMKAFHTLMQHGIDPRPHPNPDVNIVLLSVERSVAPEPSKLEVPTAPPPPPVERNPRIRIGKE